MAQPTAGKAGCVGAEGAPSGIWSHTVELFSACCAQVWEETGLGSGKTSDNGRTVVLRTGEFVATGVKACG